MNIDRLLSHLTKHLQFEADQVNACREACADSTPIYVMRRPSLIDCALARAFLEAQNLPPLTKTQLTPSNVTHGNSDASLLFLRRRRGEELSLRATRFHRQRLRQFFCRWPDSGGHPKTVFIPLSVFAGHGPQPWFGRFPLPLDFPYLPLGDLWLGAVYQFYRDTLRISIGPALTLDKSNCEEFSSLLSRELYSHEKATRGAKQHLGSTIKQIVLSGEEFESSLQDYASMNDASRSQGLRLAEKVFNEIRATTNGRIIAILHTVLHPIFRRIFPAVHVHNIERIRSAVTKGPVLLLPSHRSHADYLLLTYCLYRSGLPLPYIAAGSNLNIFLVGSILRAAGAFFIRRKVGKDPIYKTVLERYLRYLIKQGHLVEIYIEGGRSRSGLARPPRLGLLKYVIQCLTESERRDVQIVPIGIAYEEVPEERAIAREIDGAPKRPENIFQVIGLLTFLKKRFPPVTFSVGNSFSVREIASDLAKPSLRRLTDTIGYKAARGFNQQCAITSTSIVSASFISGEGGQQSASDLCRRISDLVRCCSATAKDNHHGLFRAVLSAASESEANDRSSLLLHSSGLLQLAIKRGLLTVQEPTGAGSALTGAVSAPPFSIATLFYYSNQFLGHFADLGLAELAHRNCSDASSEDLADALFRLFMVQFTLPKKIHVWKQRLANIYSASHPEFDGAREVVCSLLLPYFEACQIVLEHGPAIASGGTFESDVAEQLLDICRRTSDLSLVTATRPILEFAINFAVYVRALGRKHIEGSAQPMLFRSGFRAQKYARPTEKLLDSLELRNEFLRDCIKTIKSKR